MFRPNRLFFLATVFFTSALLSSPSFAGDLVNGQFSIPTVATPVIIDAKLDDKAWQHATAIAVNIEMSPGENVKAPVETTAYIMSDNDTLYVALKL